MSGLTEEAITKIQRLVEAQQKTIVIGENTYSDYQLKRIYSDPRPARLELSTLDGVADYIKKNLDSIKEETCMIIINSFNKVSVLSPVQGEKNDRHEIAISTLEDLEKFRFGKFMPQEEFIISFSALFGDTEDKTKILNAASVMQVIDQAAGDDDGNTTARTIGNQVICPNVDEMPKTVVFLKPFRTFREIEQPESGFIFRYRKSQNGFPEIALFEADGGAWKLTAKSRIKEYLANLTDTAIIC
ncbi:hypothetical protein KAR91_02345 [Candidatus Pacearchaeota archaeon]|nr:hypothetical protein [Candidatus Pacearchaeota archaeon]